MSQPISGYFAAPTCGVAITDDEARAATRQALAGLGVDVTIDAVDIEELLAEAIVNPPAVAVIGSQVTGGGVAAVRRVVRAAPDCAVVLLAAEPNDTQMFDALSAGAVGYLPRDIAPGSLALALVGVLDGEVALTRSMMARVVEELQGRPGRRVRANAAPATKLTSREWDVASLMKSGASTQQIAARLYMSTSTVRVHVCNILRKLHATDRESAIRVLAQI